MDKSIQKFVNDPSFYKIYSRNSSLFSVETFGHSSRPYLNDLYGVDWSELVVNNNGFIDVYGLEKEKKEVSLKILERIKSSESIKDFFEDIALNDFEGFIENTEELRDKYKKETNLSDEVNKDFNRFNKLYSKLLAHCYFIFMVDVPLGEELDLNLRRVFPKDTTEEINIKKEIISIPVRKTGVVNERISFLLLKALEGTTNFNNALENHHKEYNWFPVYNPFDDVYTLNYYREELDKMDKDSAKKELEHISKETESHVEKYNSLLLSISDEYLKKLVELTNELSYYREKRNDIRRKGLSYARGMFDAVADSLKLDLKEFCYLSKEEISLSLENGSLVISKDTVRQRIESFVALFEDKSVILNEKKDIEEVNKVIEEKTYAVKQLQGKVGSKGSAKGKAFLIDDISKLLFIEEGDVLIASMTGPDYVPAMRKAAAIVTDEGGITSHAAIIARELGKPCVIGTKIATKVFKDGDLIEVNANNGIVKFTKDNEA